MVLTKKKKLKKNMFLYGVTNLNSYKALYL